MRLSLNPITVAGLFFGVCIQAGCTESTTHDNNTGFTLPTEVVLPEIERHPSLWFHADDVPELMAKRSADAHLGSLWASIMASPFLLADLSEVPEVDDDKQTIHRYYGDLTQIAFYNAFLYQVGEPDRKKAYLAAATAALLRGYEGPLYNLDPLIKGSAVDEIYQGVWAQNFAAAYDMVQPGLTPEQDTAIRAILSRHAQYIHDNLLTWVEEDVHGPHNHLSKPAWGLGSLALALSGHENARAWLERAVEGANRNTRVYFGEDGLYREGSFYYIFSLVNLVPFLHHYENVSGAGAFSVYQPAFEWPILVRNGKGWMPNQEDSFIVPFPSQLVAGAYRDTPTGLHPSASLGSILQWNFENTDYGPFEASEAVTGFNYTGASWDYPKPLVEFLTYAPDLEAVAPVAGPTVFLPSGQTVFRNDWSFGDPAHRYLLFQGVAEAMNHQHFEHLGFILQAENQMMSSDSGYTRKSYGDPIRTEWYRTPEAHNVVMVNGQAPVDRSKDITPESRFRLVSPFFDCEMKRAPYAVGGEHRRLIALVDGQRFIIVDQVDLRDDAEISIVMHGGRARLEQKGPLSVWSYQDDNYGPAAVLGQWFFGAGFEGEEKSGELTYIKGDYAAFPYFVQTRQSSHALALSVLEPAGTVAALADLQPESVDAGSISIRAAAHRILVGKGDEVRSIEGLESDAMLAVSWIGDPAKTRLAMTGGRVLRIPGQVSVELDATSACALEVSPDHRSIILHLAEDSPVEARISMGELRWEGRLVPGRQTVSLESGG